jgi:hypothetical protein
MTPEIKAQWIADLRSGNFVQGKAALHPVEVTDAGEKHTFCCLGLLAEAAVAAGVVERERDPLEYSTTSSNYVCSYRTPGAEYGTSKYLSDVIIDWAGLADDAGDPFVTINGEYRKVSYHNDHGATFEEIAQALEDQLPTDDDDAQESE